MPKMIVLGHSHLGGLSLAYRDRERANRTGDLTLSIVKLRQERYMPEVIDGKLHPEIERELRETEHCAVVSMIGGNSHTIIGLVNHPTPFDFVLPDEPDLEIQDGAAILPSGVVRRRLERATSHLFETIAAIRAICTGRFFQMESPPPVRDESHIRNFPRTFEEMIKERGVAPATLRYKLWRLHSAIFEDECRRIGVEFVPAPREMQDDQGMLLPAGWMEDPTHAGPQYGEAQYRQLVSLTQRIAAEGAGAA